MVRIEPIRDRPSFKCILAWRCVWFSLALPSSPLKGSFSWISTQLYHSFSWPLSILVFIYVLEDATLSYLLHFSFFYFLCLEPLPGKFLLLLSLEMPFPWKSFHLPPNSGCFPLSHASAVLRAFSSLHCCAVWCFTSCLAAYLLSDC